MKVMEYYFCVVLVLKILQVDIFSYNNQINASALIGQSAVGYCYYNPHKLVVYCLNKLSTYCIKHIFGVAWKYCSNLVIIMCSAGNLSVFTNNG